MSKPNCPGKSGQLSPFLSSSVQELFERCTSGGLTFLIRVLVLTEGCDSGIRLCFSVITARVSFLPVADVEWR